MTTAAAEQTGQATWTIDPAHSSVEFAVRHLMITTVRGRFTDVKGTVTVDDAAPAKSAVEVVIDAASIDTREPQRDTHLRSADFFDVEKFPTLTFRSTKVDGGLGEPFTLAGDLTTDPKAYFNSLSAEDQARRQVVPCGPSSRTTPSSASSRPCRPSTTCRRASSSATAFVPPTCP